MCEEVYFHKRMDSKRAQKQNEKIVYYYTTKEHKCKINEEVIPNEVIIQTNNNNIPYEQDVFVSVIRTRIILLKVYEFKHEIENIRSGLFNQCVE